MRRLLQMTVGLGGGLLILFWIWSIPVHWRDVDESVLAETGKNGESLEQTWERAHREGRWALANWSGQLLQEFSRSSSGEPHYVPGPLQESAWQREWRDLGGMDSAFWLDTRPSEALMKTEVLAVSRQWAERRSHGMAEKLRGLAGLTGRQFFPPAGSRAERPWLVALEVASWLSRTGGLAPALENELSSVIDQTGASEVEVRMAAVQHLEGFMASLLSLGRRYNWEELPVITRSVGRMEELSSLAQMVAQFPEEQALVGVTLHYLGRVHPLLNYRSQFPDYWLRDLRSTIPHGRVAVRTLVLEEQILYRGPVNAWIRLANTWIPQQFLVSPHQLVQNPEYWLWMKTVGLFVGTLFLSFGLAALARLRPFIPSRGIAWWHPLLIVRQLTLALCLGAVLMWMGEPGLLRTHMPDSLFQSAGFSIQFTPDLEPTEKSRMIPEFDNLTWLMLGLFFSLQLLIYIIGLLKISQIRGLQLDPAFKLELLANEENLFDCGLYLGIGGTVTALVMLAMHILQPSLVAAYSSTLFGILFVALLKVGHVRPYRRQLLLNRENIVAL